MGYGKLSMMLDRAMRVLSALSRAPKVATVDLPDADASSLESVEPVFVLSTGRCGTKWLTQLLNQDKRLRVNHSDYPELLRESRMAFDEYESEPRLFQEILRSARDGYLIEARQQGLNYVETNHRITFFARAIREVYPRARFIHLHRHPGEFVRSGIRRRWYSDSYLDICRPRLADDEVWNVMTNVERLAWLWNTTNQYIEDFVSELGSSDVCLRVCANDLFNDAALASRVAKFAGAKLSESDVASLVGTPVNKQHTGSMARYDDWSDEDKAALKRLTPLAKDYGYDV